MRANGHHSGHFHHFGVRDRFAVRGVKPRCLIRWSAHGGSVWTKKLLAGKSAIVTGGGSGINLAIAHRFASQGASVALIGRTKEKLESASDEIRKAGGTASGHPG